VRRGRSAEPKDRVIGDTGPGPADAIEMKTGNRSHLPFGVGQSIAGVVNGCLRRKGGIEHHDHHTEGFLHTTRMRVARRSFRS